MRIQTPGSDPKQTSWTTNTRVEYFNVKLSGLDDIPLKMFVWWQCLYSEGSFVGDVCISLQIQSIINTKVTALSPFYLMTSCWHFCKHRPTYTLCPEFHWNALRNYLWTDSLCKHHVGLSMTAGSPCGSNKSLRIDELCRPIASSPNKIYIFLKSPRVPVPSKSAYFLDSPVVS